MYSLRVVVMFFISVKRRYRLIPTDVHLSSFEVNRRRKRKRERKNVWKNVIGEEEEEEETRANRRIKNTIEFVLFDLSSGEQRIVQMTTIDTSK